MPLSFQVTKHIMDGYLQISFNWPDSVQNSSLTYPVSSPTLLYAQILKIYEAAERDSENQIYWFVWELLSFFSRYVEVSVVFFLATSYIFKVMYVCHASFCALLHAKRSTFLFFVCVDPTAFGLLVFEFF